MRSAKIMASTQSSAVRCGRPHSFCEGIWSPPILTPNGLLMPNQCPAERDRGDKRRWWWCLGGGGVRGLWYEMESGPLTGTTAVTHGSRTPLRLPRDSASMTRSGSYIRSGTSCARLCRKATTQCPPPEEEGKIMGAVDRSLAPYPPPQDLVRKPLCA